MALIKLERIISVTSEDPNHSAENLLNTNYSDKKWKCKNVGEKQISIVIQFEKPSKINSIDVGNFGSAFIEILVGKSSCPDDFKVLVVTSSLMSLSESKLGTNVTGVRFFKEDVLSKPISMEKWDRVKIICSQPYNKHSQYGLSFIIFRTDPSSQSVEPKASALGKFQLKPISTDNEITAGSLFARRKELIAEQTSKPQGGSAAIRMASVAAMTNNTLPPECKLKEIKKGSQTNTSPALPTPLASKENVTPKRNGTRTNGLKKDSHQTKRKQSPVRNKPEVPKKKRLEKPFCQLLEGVVFTISGFENPYRSIIRNKALEMGAQFRRDWDSSCTHLLCAFPNTPKFKQVLGKGKILSKEWFESCYSRRMKLPWRRYSLSPADKNKPESDEEVFEAVARPASPPDNRRRANSPSSGEDTEDEIEKVKQAQLKKANKQEINAKKKTVDKKKSDDDMKGVAGPSGNNVFDADTDIEEDIQMVNSPIPSHMYLPSLPSIFQNISFLIDEELPDDDRRELKRYIIANNGTVLDEIDDFTDVEYVISESPTTVKKLKEKFNPNLIGLRPEWIWRAHDKGRLIPSSAYEL